MNRPGDWNCRSCNHLNFQRRDSCQRCREPRPGDHHFGSFGGGGGGIRGGGSSSFGSGFSSGPDVRPGDWYCPLGNCGAHNFASRSSCYKCGAYKDESAGSGVMGGGPFDGFDGMSARGSRGYGFGSMSTGGTGGVGGSSRSAWKSGDWICNMPGCNEHNFASRMECFRCSAPREASGKSAF